MKLASALSERANLQRRIAALGERLNNNAKTQEGEPPAEDPALLLQELDQNMVRLEELIRRINLTNSQTVSEGETLTALLARRDAMEKRLSILRSFLTEASSKIDRYSRTEIKIVSTVDVAALQKDVDLQSKQLRELDECIQALNWTTELL